MTPIFLAALFLTQSTLLAMVAGVSVAAVGALAYYRFDDKRERRRETAIEVHAFFAELGLEHTSDFVKHYAIGDKDGMAKDFVQIAKIVANPEKRLLETRKAALKVIAGMADDDAEYAKVFEVLHKGRLGKEPLPAELKAAATLLDVEVVEE